MTDMRRALIWQDAQGEQTLHLIRTAAGASAIQTQLLLQSNGVVLEESEGSITTTLAMPATTTYLSVRQVAVLLFRDSRTGSTARLYVPAPLASLFGSTGDAVDPAAAGGIITAALGNLVAGSGNTVDMFVGGYLTKARPMPLETTDVTQYINPMTSLGDMVYSNDSHGDATRLPIGTSGQILEVVSGVPSWQSPALLPVKVSNASARGTGTGDYTTTSTTMVDVDGTNLKVSLSAASGDVLCVAVSCSVAANVSGACGVTVNVGGTVLGDSDGIQFSNVIGDVPLSFTVLHTVASGEISGGSVTVKVQWLTTGGTATMFNRSAVVRPQLTVLNLLQ